MRIVFFGTPELAVPTLESVAGRHTITAVVCQPDKAQGRSKKLVPPPVKVRALELGILALLQPRRRCAGRVGIVYEDVEPAEAPERELHGRDHLLALAHVGAQEMPARQRRRRARAGVGIELGDHHRRARGVEPPRDALAHALSRAGDQCHPVVQ